MSNNDDKNKRAKSAPLVQLWNGRSGWGKQIVRRKWCASLNEAIREDDLEEVKRLYKEKGERFGATSCNLAAYLGHLDCLVYAIDHGAPFCEITATYAAQNGCVDVLEFLIERRNEIITDRVFEEAWKSKRFAVLNFLITRGYHTLPNVVYDYYENHFRTEKSVSPSIMRILRRRDVHRSPPSPEPRDEVDEECPDSPLEYTNIRHVDSSLRHKEKSYRQAGCDDDDEKDDGEEAEDFYNHRWRVSNYLTE